MAIFNHQKRSKKKSQESPVGITAITLNSPGILSIPGYHSLAEAPEVDSAIRLIADLIASAPIHLMENTDKGDKRVRDNLAKKIDIDPYSLGTRQTFVHWIVATMLQSVGGEAVVIPRTAGGLVQDLVPAPDASIHKDYGSPTYYAYYDGRKYDADDILHFRLRPDPLYPWRGQGLQVQFQQVVDSIVQTAETKTAYMSSEYKPPIIIAVNSDSPLAEEEERDAFLKKYFKRDDKSKPWILPADLMTVHQVKPLSLADLAIKDGVELDKKTVASILGIPCFLLGIGTFNQQEYNTFIRTRIKPICEVITQELTKKLLTSEKRYFKFNIRALYSYTLTELSTIARDLRAAGMMDGNEGRNWIDLEPRDGLDELVMLENYIPASLLGNQQKLVGAAVNKEESKNDE